jgi:hypothetical protein
MHKDILILIVTQVPIHETEADCTETRLTVGGICMLKILIVPAEYPVNLSACSSQVEKTKRVKLNIHVIGRSAVVGIRICWFTDTAFRRRWLVEKFVWIVCCKWWFTGKWGSSGWLYTGHSVIT